MATPRSNSYTVPSGGAVYAGRDAPAAMPAWRRGKTPGEWFELVSNTIDSLAPENNPAINPNYPSTASWASRGPVSDLVGAYSSGAWNEDTGTFDLAGGGHDGNDGNELFRIRLYEDTPAWAMMGYPTGSIQRPGVPRTRNVNRWGSDGRPLGIHTYGMMAPMPNGRVFFGVGGAAYDSASNPTPYEFDPVANDFDLSRVYTCPVGFENLSGIGNPIACLDPVREKVWQTWGARLIVTDLATRVVTKPRDFGYGGDFGLGEFFYMKDFDLLVKVSDVADCGATGKSVCLIDPANPGAAPVGINAVTTPWNKAICFDTKRRRFYHWAGAGATTMDVLQAPSGNPKTDPWVYSSMAVSTAIATPQPLMSAGTYKRFWYSEKLDAICSINSTSKTLFCLPLS